MESRYLRKVMQLTPLELSSLVQAIVLLPVISVTLRIFGFRRVYAVLGISRLSKSDVSETTAAHLPLIMQINHMVDIATRRVIFQPTCLERSLVLWLLLHRKRISSGLRIGVHMSVGKLEAHAWIESLGYVVNDSQDVNQRFAQFDRLLLPQGVDWH